MLVPHFSSSDFFTDPAHKHAFSSRSFDYFVAGTELYRLNYSRARFLKRRVQLGFPSRNPLKNVVLRFINRYPEWYEKRLAFILPVGSILFELEVVK